MFTQSTNLGFPNWNNSYSFSWRSMGFVVLINLWLSTTFSAVFPVLEQQYFKVSLFPPVFVTIPPGSSVTFIQQLSSLSCVFTLTIFMTYFLLPKTWFSLSWLFYLLSYNLVSFFSFLNFSKVSLWLATLNFLNPNQWKILILWKASFCLRDSHETSLCTVTNGFLIARSSGLFSVFNLLWFLRRLGQSATRAFFCCVYT